AASDGRLVAARVAVTGASRAHAALAARPEHWESEIRARAIHAVGSAAWIERGELDTRPAIDLDALAPPEASVGPPTRAPRAPRAARAGRERGGSARAGRGSRRPAQGAAARAARGRRRHPPRRRRLARGRARRGGAQPPAAAARRRRSAGGGLRRAAALAR